MANQMIELENVGPIEGRFEIDLDAGPGLYEVRGSKGSGKSTILTSLGLIGGNKTTLTIHDGEFTGSVKAFGVTAPVQSSKRRKGELEAEILDSSKFDLLDLIDPPGKTAEARDAVRLKALAALTGLKVDLGDFASMLDGKPADEWGIDRETEDPVLLASRVKAALEREARTQERLADSKKGEAEACAAQTEGIDLTAECDEKVLRERMDAAYRLKSDLLAKGEAALEHAQRLQEARKRLDVLEAGRTGPTIEACQKELGALGKRLRGLTEKVVALQRKLEEARDEERAAERDVEEWRRRLETATEHQQEIEQARQILDETVVEAPTDEQVQQATDELDLAVRAYEQAEIVRRAKLARNKAQALAHEADRAKEVADGHREAAASVFTVLADRMQTKGIRIRDVDGSPRLIVDHPSRGMTLFDQDNGLSDGERVMATLDELLPLLGSPGLLPIPQRIYQDLQPTDRQVVAKYAKERGIYVFGAQIDDSDLHVEVV